MIYRFLVIKEIILCSLKKILQNLKKKINVKLVVVLIFSKNTKCVREISDLQRLNSRVLKLETLLVFVCIKFELKI